MAHKGYRTQEAAHIRERKAADRREALQSLSRVLLTKDPGAARIRRWTRDIGRLLLLASPYAREPNFTRIHIEDLSFLFSAYDTRFLDGLCQKLLGTEGVSQFGSFQAFP